MTQKNTLFANLDELVADLTSSTKRASDTSEGGPTSFPKVEDPTRHSLVTGSQYSDNTSEVNKQNSGQTVQESASPSPTQDKQKDVNTGDGITLSAVGEDPSVEDDYKGNLKDPGTTSPARVDDGQKYAKMSLPDLFKAAKSLSDDVLSELAGVPAPTKSAATTPANNAIAAGFQLAGMAAQTEKQATVDPHQFTEQTIRDAIYEADLFARHYGQFKAAAEDPAADKTPPDDPAAGGGGPPSPPAGGGGDAPPPGGGAPGPAAGIDGEASLAAQPPGEDEAMHALLSAMAEKGISPQSLLEIIQSIDPMGGGDPAGVGGGMPPGGGMEMGAEAPGLGGDPSGGAPPPAPGGGMPGGGPPPVPPMGDKMAHNRAKLANVADRARQFQLTGRFRFNAAKSAREQVLRNNMHEYINELARASGIRLL